MLIKSYTIFAWLAYADGASETCVTRLCCSALAEAIRLNRFGLRFLIKEGLMTSIKTISQKLAAWRRYRDAVRELSQLSDRELEDIGIRRGDIPFIAASSVQAA